MACASHIFTLQTPIAFKTDPLRNEEWEAKIWKNPHVRYQIEDNFNTNLNIANNFRNLKILEQGLKRFNNLRSL